MDKIIEHSSPGSTSKTSNCPNAYVYLDAEFCDLTRTEKKNVLHLGRFGLSMIQ